MKQNKVPGQSRISVLIVDDHPTVREALAVAVDDRLDMYVCGQTASALDALDLVDSLQPDVAIVDLMLDDGYGLDLIQNIHARSQGVRMIVFSMYDEDVYAERALRAGAMGYLMKKEPTTHVIQAIRSVMRDDVYLSTRMAMRMLSTLGRDSRQPGLAHDALTDRELEVLQLIGHGIGITEIAERLHLTRKTIETYRRRVAEKLGLSSTDELLQYAMRWADRALAGEQSSR